MKVDKTADFSRAQSFTKGFFYMLLMTQFFKVILPVFGPSYCPERVTGYCSNCLQTKFNLI